MKRSAYSFQPQLKVCCYHVAQAERLFVKKVTVNDLLKRWIPLNPGKTLTMDDSYYVQCDSNGIIKWDKNTKIYTSFELVGRNNVHIVTSNGHKEAMTSQL
jgi:hypothetical protein